MAPLLVSQAGVLGSQPPVPVIALTGDDPAGAFPRRIASEIDTDGWAAAVCFVSSAYTLAVKPKLRSAFGADPSFIDSVRFMPAPILAL